MYDPDRLVIPMNTSVTAKGEAISVAAGSPAKFAHWRAQASVLEDVSAYDRRPMNYTGGGVAEQLSAMQASADFFRCVGTPFELGRGFTPAEDAPNGPKAAVLSHEFWTRRFAADPNLPGKAISLNGAAYTVVGVMARNRSALEFGPTPDVVVPFQLDPKTSDQGHYFTVLARLKPGITLEQAQQRLQASAAEFRAKFPVFPMVDGFSVAPFRETEIGNIGSEMLPLAGAVALVLLIACANVANLLLVRGTARRREIAIRSAIGAGRGRMIRQLLTESLLLSLAGGALGLLLGFAGIRLLLAVDTAGLPRVGEYGAAVSMDWRVVGFAFVLSLLTGVVFGLFPAIEGSRADVNSVLKNSCGRSGTGFGQNKARSVLVVCEVGLAVVLMVGSALLIRTFLALYAADRGFDTNHVLTMRMSMTGPNYLKSSGVAEAVRDGLGRIETLPGVEMATASCCVPLSGGFTLPFNIAGKPPVLGPFAGVGGWTVVSPGYFKVFKIPVKRGREFTAGDDAASPPVVLINESMAKRYWQDADPLRDRIVIGRGVRKEMMQEPVRQILGIVGDVRDGGLGIDPRPIMYVPQAQLPDAVNAFVQEMPMAWLIRTQPDPRRLASAIQDQLQQATGLPAAEVRSMDEVMSVSTGRRRFNMLLMTVFGGAALLLAAIGF